MDEIKDLKLEEPNEEGETKLDLIIELFERAAAEFKTTKEREYWQGRKDGLRAALAILEPGNSYWERANKSSPGFRREEKEVFFEFIKDARYNIGAALWEYSEKGKRIDVQTIINLLQWLEYYDRQAEKGELDPAPDAITPDWGLLTRGKRTPK